jgi:transposase-like protein
MKHDGGAPKTLLDAVKYFSDPDTALNFMVAIRWPEGVICPRCSASNVKFLATRRLWKCYGCTKQFSVKVGTIFEDSPIALEKWLPCLLLIANGKNGISSYEVARALGVTQKTAWFMLHRVRLAMQGDNFGMFGGSVEADETFIGGKARFMHKAKRDRVIKARGSLGKVAVMGLLERHGKGHSRVRVSVIGTTAKSVLHRKVKENVRAGANLYTDEALGSRALKPSTSTTSSTTGKSTLTD